MMYQWHCRALDVLREGEEEDDLEVVVGDRASAMYTQGRIVRAQIA